MLRDRDRILLALIATIVAYVGTKIISGAPIDSGPLIFSMFMITGLIFALSGLYTIFFCALYTEKKPDPMYMAFMKAKRMGLRGFSLRRLDNGDVTIEAENKEIGRVRGKT